MNEIAQKRRQIRLQAGSVMFLNREFTFSLDNESRYPLSFKESPKMQSKSLVEEYMLLANIYVAEYLYWFCKDKTLLRAHNDISQEKKDKLYDFFDKVGLKGIDLTNATTLSHSMERMKETGSKEDLDVLNRKFLTCLTQAKYVTV
jgi:exoribonuclease R